ncbi:DNA mismatch repair protein MutL, partial [bacterium]|nr:DNA mismatch repair protein MutL [bacterium]
MKINLLADEVASQIAAGEVVERPASVVKELVENAIDAGASRIDIRVVGAGQRLIEVADDGGGILPEDLALAVARHATSKLRSAEDLFHIQTLGFRGEALASIGSVSRMTISSRSADHEVGSRIRVDGGKVQIEEKAGVPVGTSIQVEDLFFNTPARLKFLKKELTERQQITAFVTRYALAYPLISFHLTMEGTNEFNTSGAGNRREVLAQIY